MSKIFDNNMFKVLSFIRNVYNNIDRKAETINNTKRKAWIGWTIVIIFFFSILLLLNILTPMIADDFCYLLIFDGVFQTRVTSISDVILSQWDHYFLWGGRSIVHFIAQSLLLLPPIITDILNTIAYIAYTLLIYIHIKGNKPNDFKLFILINLAVWFIQPAFGDTVLWITGSANYLWGMIIVLIFLIPFRLYKGEKKSKKYTFIKTLSLFLLGIIAGWTNENTAIAMIVIAILYLIYYKNSTHNIPCWGISGISGAVIGYIIMIMAPGNFMRAGEAVSFDWLVLAYRLVNHTWNFIVNCGSLNLVGLIIFVLYWHYTKQNRSVILKSSFIFFVGVLISVYSMILSPSFPPRAWFGVATYNIIGVGIILYNLDWNYRFLKQIYYGILLMGIIAFPFSFYFAFKDIYSVHSSFKEREIVIQQAKREGLPYCEVERYNTRTKFVHSEDLEANKFMYAYYGIDIRFE